MWLIAGLVYGILLVLGWAMGHASKEQYPDG